MAALLPLLVGSGCAATTAGSTTAGSTTAGSTTAGSTTDGSTTDGSAAMSSTAAGSTVAAASAASRLARAVRAGAPAQREGGADPAEPGRADTGLHISELYVELDGAAAPADLEAEIQRRLVGRRAFGKHLCKTSVVLDLTAYMIRSRAAAVLHLRWMVSTPQGRILALWQQSVEVPDQSDASRAWRAGLRVAVDSVEGLLEDSAQELQDRTAGCDVLVSALFKSRPREKHGGKPSRPARRSERAI